jgi:ATP-binding cassette subfamily B protein IrtA
MPVADEHSRRTLTIGKAWYSMKKLTSSNFYLRIGRSGTGRRTAKNGKKAEALREIINIYFYARRYWKTMYAAVAFLTLSVIMGVVPYFLIYRVMMRFTGAGAVTTTYLGSLAGLILVSLFLKTYLHNKGLAASHHLAYDTLMGMRQSMVDKLLKMPMGAIARRGAGGLKKNFVENIEDMEIILAHAIPEGLSNLLTLVIVTLTLAALDRRLALLALAVLPLGAAPVLLMVKDGLKKMGPYYQASKEMNENIIEYISGMEVIKVFNQTTTSFKKYRMSVDQYKQFTLDWYRVSWNYLTLYSIILPSTLLCLLPCGALFYIKGALTLDRLVLSILLAMSMGLPLTRLVEFIPLFPMLKHRAAKVGQLFAAAELEDGAAAVGPPNHTVTFEKVTFAYEGRDVLQNVSLVAPENTVTALVGESGAGKSTLAKLLVRFWDVKAGTVTIGGRDIREFSLATLMKLISYVSQDVFLFNTTIMENIRMGRPDAGDVEVIQMAKIAQCHDFIMETAAGYQTVVGAAGDKLSGGQRQRIAIARALLKNAPIVVLDEATSFTDPENEDKIQAALSGLIRGKTLIVIAHRLSTIVGADQIVLLDGGKISARGTHRELLAVSPLYRKMWRAHQESLNWDIAAKERSGLYA